MKQGAKEDLTQTPFVQGHHCVDVERKVAKKVPRQRCKTIPQEHCEKVPRKVGRPVCKSVPGKRSCRKVPKKVPSQNCIQESLAILHINAFRY